MVDFIELEHKTNKPFMIRKSNVVAIYSQDDGTVLLMNSGEMFHVKQSYDEIKEQFKFE